MTARAEGVAASAGAVGRRRGAVATAGAGVGLARCTRSLQHLPGKYSLGVPSTEFFFQLARLDSDLERAGYVGMITANSFMKREMGKSLIEKWVPAHDITHVIDTSGAYIPGHGTPTVILFGRNRRPVSSTVWAVMGIRGEPSTPADPEKALV